MPLLSSTQFKYGDDGNIDIDASGLNGDGIDVEGNKFKVKHGLTLTRGETLDVNKEMFKPRAGYGIINRRMIGYDPQCAATTVCRDFIFVFYRRGSAEVYTLDWEIVRELTTPKF